MQVYPTARRIFLNLLRRVGLQAQKVCPVHTAELAVVTMLNGHGVDLVLDVGANTGQFGEELFDWGYRGSILSFEPLAGPYAALERAATRHPGCWEVAPRCALGASAGEITVNVSQNCVASSVLELSPNMDDYSKLATYTSSETVPLKTLDEAAAPWLDGARRPFLKIDVQGYEAAVLDGAALTIPRLTGLQIELSFVELYAGQELFSEMLSRIEGYGFVLHHMEPSFYEVATGRWLQVDALFFRPRGAAADARQPRANA